MARDVERQVIEAIDPQPGDLWRRGLVLTVSIALGLGLLAGLWLFARPLALVIIGVVIGEALKPLVEWESRRLPRTIAVTLTYLCIGVAVGALAYFALAPLVGQAQDLRNSLPSLINQAATWLQRQDERVTSIPIIETLWAEIESFTGTLFALPMTVATSLFDALLVLFLSLYWLLAAPRTGRFVLSLFPQDRRERVGEVLAKLSHTVGGYVRGVGINVALVAVASYIGLRLIGMPFPLILSMIAGLLEIIPIVGPFVAGVIIVGVALSQSLQTALIALAFVVALQQFEGNLLTPMVMRSQTDLHPFLILVAVVVGGGVGGLLGVLVAIPLMGIAKVIIVEVIAPALRRRVGAQAPKQE